MKTGVQTVSSWFRMAYDRLIAFAVLLALLLSLVFLGLQAKTLKNSQDAFDIKLNDLRPHHEQAAPVSIEKFKQAETELTAPMALPDWSNRLMVAELRVRCENCERPIPYDATVCVYCKTPQRPEMEAPKDKDKDGMLDEWEVKCGFNPLDPDDAFTDADADGYKNIEEFENRTDPRDASSYPPPSARLTVEQIKPIAFPLLFKAVSRLGTNLTFQINLRTGTRRTYWPNLGDTIEGGFKLVAYDEKAEKGPTLTLELGGKHIQLIKNQDVPHNEYEVTLKYNVDGSVRTVRVGGEFEMKGGKYTVKEVDTLGHRVLIRDVTRQMDVWIGHQVPEATAATSSDADL